VRYYGELLGRWMTVLKKKGKKLCSRTDSAGRVSKAKAADLHVKLWIKTWKPRSLAKELYRSVLSKTLEENRALTKPSRI